MSTTNTNGATLRKQRGKKFDLRLIGVRVPPILNTAIKREAKEHGMKEGRFIVEVLAERYGIDTSNLRKLGQGRYQQSHDEE